VIFQETSETNLTLRIKSLCADLLQECYRSS